VGNGDAMTRKVEGRGTVRVFGGPAFRSPSNSVELPATMTSFEGTSMVSVNLAPAPVNPARNLESLSPVQLSADYLIRNNLFPSASGEPTAAAFDMLRGSVLQGLSEKGWSRVAVTSPTHGCGKSFVATNLALALARRPESRNVLIDLDLRRPRVAEMLGLTESLAFEDFLTGVQPMETQFRRYGKTLALGLNNRAVAAASECLHAPYSKAALARVQTDLEPQVTLFDMPPVLVCDDVLAIAGSVDCVLLVTDGTRSSPEEIRAAESALRDRIPLLCVVLNRALDTASKRYGYGKGKI
jgi:Mrp family chromosome partitioning ATPase